MKKCRRDDRLPPRGNLVPEGYDRGEYAKVSAPLFQMLDDLVDRYQEYICERLLITVRVIPSLI